jgi:hypothetical protein
MSHGGRRPWEFRLEDTLPRLASEGGLLRTTRASDVLCGADNVACRDRVLARAGCVRQQVLVCEGRLVLLL